MKILLIASTMIITSTSSIGGTMSQKIFEQCGYPSPSQECIQHVMSNQSPNYGNMSNLPSVSLPEITQEAFESVEHTKKLINIGGWSLFKSKFEEQYQLNCKTGHYTLNTVTECTLTATDLWYKNNLDKASSHLDESEVYIGSSIWDWLIILSLLAWVIHKFKGNEETTS